MIRRILAVLFLLAVPAGAYAQPARWSWDRVSVGADTKALVTKAGDSQTTAFCPGAYLSYSLASNLSVAGTVERDLGSDLTIAQLGARVKVLDTTRGDVAAGVNAVFYGDVGATMPEPTSWSASVHGAWAAAHAKSGATTIFGIASVTHDPENHRTDYRAGLRWQAWGGVPQ